ncbi:MAG: AbrB/MazE/SpoVT family DNA-binding domain-containing protein [bacterium]|nr:AbrB/MazE/SpoVT family DNA-binding domain-containing protein [bacterium]
MNITTIQKWGNSYAVRLPKTTIDKLNLQAGHSVELREATHGRALSIIPLRRHIGSLKEMVARITKKNRHSATDWGGAVGKEIW